MVAHTKEYQRAWRASHPEAAVAYSRKHFLMKKYGMTLDEYMSLLGMQDWVCAICKKPEIVNDRTGKLRVYLSVDHNHKTGKVRALLCHHCNAALGHVQDSPELLRKMADYLETNS